MSKAFEMISESLNEIIEDLEKNDGKNLTREILTDKKNFNFTALKKNYFKNDSSKNLFADRIGNVKI